MLTQLVVGSLLICITIILVVGSIGAASIVTSHHQKWLGSGHLVLKMMIALTAMILWLLAALSASVWIWAGAFMLLEQFQDFETSLYFAVVSFTTLGFGDVLIGEKWRLLSGMIAANGLILFSLATAYLIEFIEKVRVAQGTRRRGVAHLGE